ncbi:MAG: Crp/Fnr family transcriptional regulator [Hyphomonadaceae bacterium]
MTPSFNADPKQAAHIEGGPLAALLKAIPGATQSLAPDQHLTMEGSHRRSVIGVISGTLRSFRMTPDGRRHITRFVDPGGLIGLGALNAFRTSTEAVTVSRIVSFKASALEAVMARDAGVRDAVIQSLTNELVARDRIQFRLGRLWSDERVADFLLERANAAETSQDHSVTLQMSRADIADHLGVTIETISRALSRFQRDGLLRMTDAHHFIIVRRRALAALADGDGVHATHHGSPGALATAR